MLRNSYHKQTPSASPCSSKPLQVVAVAECVASRELKTYLKPSRVLCTRQKPLLGTQQPSSNRQCYVHATSKCRFLKTSMGMLFTFLNATAQCNAATRNSSQLP